VPDDHDGEIAARIHDVDVADQMQQSYIDYAMSVITARALPDVRDGLLPVHRRILYAMHHAGNTHEHGFRKSAKTVGEVIGNFHPHGDVAVYDSLVRLAQEFRLRYPLVEGHGNFGSIDGDPPAAMRYTEARLSRAAGELLRDLEKNTVDFVSNYDDTDTEPVVLPARLPNLLCNGSIGIAVGMSTNIPPHNLREVAAAITAFIDDPALTSQDLTRYVSGPDFPTGAIILGREGIRQAYETGHGSITIRSRAEIVETRADRYQIVISEIPYQTNKTTIIERIAELYREKRLEGVSGVTDASDRHGIRLLVDLQRGANANVVLNQLYKDTPLQQSYSMRMLALVNGRPRMLSLRDIIHHYVQHQREVVLRRTRYDLERAERRAHILEGLLIALDHLDEVIALIRSSRTRPEASAALQERFSLSELQAEAILDMRLAQLTGLEREKLEAELAELRALIEHLRAILGSEELLLDVIKQELREVVERHGDARRTEIMSGDSGTLSAEDLVDDVPTVLTLTRAGYCKRTPLDTYRSQGRGGRGVAALTTRENDFVTDLLVPNTHDYVHFFTTAGRVFRLRVYEVPEASRTARGTALVNLLALAEGEKVASVICVRAADIEYAAADSNEEAEEEGADEALPEDGPAGSAPAEDSAERFLLLCTRRGRVKRLRLRQLASIRRNGLLVIGLESGDALGDVRLCGSGDEVLLVSRRAQAARFPSGEVRVMGRMARGVAGMRLGPEDEVLGMAVVEDGADLLTVSELGMGKRTALKEFPSHHRGSTGVGAQKLGPRTGLLAGARVVRPEHEVMLITAQGTLIRQNVDGISRLGRLTMGVRVMRPEAGDAVVALASVASDDADTATGQDG
jgi:DNA gyrase subunit A